MDIRAFAGEIEQLPAEAAIVTIFEDKTSSEESRIVLSRADAALNGLISKLLQSQEITGKFCETTLIHTIGRLKPARLLLVGLGKKEDFSLGRVRKAAGTAVRFLRKRGCRKISTLLHGTGLGISPTESARAIVEGSLVGLYNPDLHKTADREPSDLDELLLVSPQQEVAETLAPAISEGEITAGSINLARDLGNEPANILTPAEFAHRAVKLADSASLKIQIIENEEMRRLGMGALLAVGSGSDHPPKLIAISYKPVQGAHLLALVGKGITFDSGGLSLKARDGMEQMKNDMAGAAAVLGAMLGIARLGLSVNVLAIMPLAENLPGSKAYRPGDVLTTLAGKTIEVISTDAEGRLILSDALAYAVQQGVTQIVDIATLTGSCAVALGREASGLFSNDNEFADAVDVAAVEAGDRLWRLPLYPEFKEKLASKVADMKNSGGKYGDASNAAAMLSQFVGGKPWVHLDIAGTDWNEKAQSYLAEGPTGVGVGILIRLAESLAKGREA